MLRSVSDIIEDSSHIEFYLYFVKCILTIHGDRMQGLFSMPTLLALEKALCRKYQQLSQMYVLYLFEALILFTFN